MSSQRRFYVALAAAGIAVAGVAAWWLQKGPAAVGQTSAAGATAAPRTSAAAAAASAAPVAVEVAPVRQMPLADVAEAVGSLRSRQSVVLRPEVPGRVTQLLFTDGARVRRGQVLVRLDDQLPRAQVQQAQAELSIARANHQRNQDLVARGFVSQRSLDESAAALQVAQAKLALAQATAARLTLRAPFDGIAGIRNVAVGDYLKDGADIVNIEDVDAIYVDFRLPERLQAKVRAGLQAQVQLDALPGARYAAVVQAVNPLLDADGRSVAVRACIDNRRLQLRPGMFARVTARLGERAQALVAPEEAIVPQGQGFSALKVVDGAAQRVAVTLGARQSGWVEVTAGLQPGDTVVVAGQQRVQKSGTPVKVAPASAAPASAAPASAAPASAALASAPGPAPEPEPALPGPNPCLQPVRR